ncbi:hypothetical protein CFOL_v3_27621, partial [Cephalotus follicularis]
MPQNNEILDISSDEEPALDDFKWLSALLYDDGGGDDDVVVVGEVKPKSKSLKPKSKSLKPTVIKNVAFDHANGHGDDDDDDCIVLDADPEKLVPIIENDDVTDTDDLLIIGHKGQIACRDYPHPRHLCAKYPFTSSPHEKHCEQCHCYVCDSLAPCCHWGTDHCHATDKEETWKAKRKSFKLAKDAPLPVLKFPDISQSVALPQVNHVQPCNIIRLAPNSMPQNQPTTIRACSSTTKFVHPNIISHGKRIPLGKNGFQPRSVLHQSLGVKNNVIQKDRGPNVGNSGPRFAPSNATLQRNYVRPATLKDPVSNVSCAHASQHSRYPAPPATSNDTNPTEWQGVCPSMNFPYIYQSSSQPNMGSNVTDTVTSQPLVYSQPIPRSDEGQKVYQLRDPSQNATNPGLSDFDYGWVNNTISSIQQPPVEDFKHQDATSTNEPVLINDFNSQSNTSTKLHCNDEFEKWMLESQPVQVVSEGVVPSEPNAIFPEPASFDAGMLLF